MMCLIIILLILFIVIISIVSEYRGTTFIRTVGVVAIAMYEWLKSLHPSVESYYPTGIGYDVNGCFCPGEVEKEFKELESTIDGMYLSNHTYNNDIFQYSFKFARTKNDVSGLELYDYIDKKVISIVQHYLHRIGNNRVSDNITAITLDDSCLTVNIARTPRGEEINNNWRCRQRNAYNQKNLDTKRERGPIEITWEGE